MNYKTLGKNIPSPSIAIFLFFWAIPIWKLSYQMIRKDQCQAIILLYLQKELLHKNPSLR